MDETSGDENTFRVKECRGRRRKKKKKKKKKKSWSLPFRLGDQ